MSVAETKAALRDWEAHKKAIFQATELEYLEDDYVRDKRIKKLEQECFKWCKYYFPHYVSSEFAPFQKRFIQAVLENDRAYIVANWARGHAKSVCCLMVVMFLVLTGKRRNILLASYNETNAIELLSAYRLEFETNQRILNDYGPQKSFSQWEAGKFITKGGASFRAIGSGQSPRGSRNQEVRPDCILFDDLDEDEMCRNPQRLDQTWEWLTGALFGCFDVSVKSLFIGLGNTIAQDSIITRAILKADFFETVNLLNENGVPSWDRYSMEDCNYLIDKMGYRMSQREYFNNPINEGKVFKKEWMVYKKLPSMHFYKAMVAYLDPGFKKTKTSDTKSWILVALHEGKFHVRKVFCALASVNEMIGWGYEIDSYVKSKNAIAQLKMEEVFLQDLLYKDFDAEGKKRNYNLPVSGDKRKKPDKDSRITAMSGHFERGNVFFDEQIQSDHHCKALVEQLTAFEPGVKCRKDGPDALEGAIFILQQMIISQADISAGANVKNKNRL